MSDSPAAQLRARLGHPVIDADGHTVEYLPALIPYLRKHGVANDLAQFFERALDPGTGLWSALDPRERARRRTLRPSWWAVPSRNTLDFASVSLPALLCDRMDELGLDFGVVYPSLGLVLPEIADAALRIPACRALNQFHADLFRGTEARLAPVAVIPMTTPDEALVELEFAVQQLGFKAVMIASYARRPVESTAALGDEAQRQANWIDSFGLDSLYDYDPFWARCIELGVSPAAHSGAFGWHGRRSISNYMYNHMGHFATASEALCKSLFLGGVTRRFPKLRIAFLEGGASWGCRLFADLLGHWEKRNPVAIRRYDPAGFDRELFAGLWQQYGGALRELAAGPDIHALAFGQPSGRAEPDDEFAACAIRTPEDIRELFAPNFYFGCEADDPLTYQAFDARALPGHARLRVLFGSDIGHWDVPDMRRVLEESYEQVERGLLDAAQFREFSFENALRFYTDSNPGFFAGTALSEQARSWVAAQAAEPAAAVPAETRRT